MYNRYYNVNLQDFTNGHTLGCLFILYIIASMHSYSVIHAASIYTTTNTTTMHQHQHYYLLSMDAASTESIGSI